MAMLAYMAYLNAPTLPVATGVRIIGQKGHENFEHCPCASQMSDSSHDLSGHKKLVRKLAGSRDFALTTLARDDAMSASRLQTAAVRGDNELLYWGVGPKVTRGDIVALYTPDSRYLPPTYRKAVRHLYCVAADVIEAEDFLHHVFLYRRVTIEPALSLRELRDVIDLKDTEVRSAGWQSKPWSEQRAERLWQYLLNSRPELAAPIAKRVIGSEQDDETAISYAGEDWIQAQRLMLWCEDADLRAFFVTSVDRQVLPIARKPLRELLEKTFSRTRVAVFLVPRRATYSQWIKAEVQAAVSSNNQILLVRTDPSRPWPLEEQHGVQRIDLALAEEGKAISKIRSLLRKAKRKSPST